MGCDDPTLLPGARRAATFVILRSVLGVRTALDRERDLAEQLRIEEGG
jgi:hypothetical protein